MPHTCILPAHMRQFGTTKVTIRGRTVRLGLWDLLNERKILSRFHCYVHCTMYTRIAENVLVVWCVVCMIIRNFSQRPKLKFCYCNRIRKVCRKVCRCFAFVGIFIMHYYTGKSTRP